MAQKANPISLRLGKTNRDFDCCWYNNSNYVYLLMRDFKIKNYINFILKKVKFSSARFLIQNLHSKVKVNVFFCNPSNSRHQMSQTFRIVNYNKKRKSKKNLFSNNHTKFSEKQNQICNYLNKHLSDTYADTAGNILPFYNNKLIQAFPTTNMIPQNHSAGLIKDDSETRSFAFRKHVKMFSGQQLVTKKKLLKKETVVEPIVSKDFMFTQAINKSDTGFIYNGLYSKTNLGFIKNVAHKVDRNCIFSQQLMTNISNKLTISNNYVKYSYVVETLNQFLIRYFMIRYFSSFLYANKTTVITSKENNFFSSLFCIVPSLKNDSGGVELSKYTNFSKNTPAWRVGSFCQPEFSLYGKKQIVLKILLNSPRSKLVFNNKKNIFIKNFMVVFNKQKIFISLMFLALQNLRAKKDNLNLSMNSFRKKLKSANTNDKMSQDISHKITYVADTCLPGAFEFYKQQYESLKNNFLEPIQVGRNCQPASVNRQETVVDTHELQISDRISQIQYKIDLFKIITKTPSESAKSKIFYKKMQALENLTYSLKQVFLRDFLYLSALPQKINFPYTLLANFINKKKIIHTYTELSPIYCNRKFDILRAYHRICGSKLGLFSTNFKFVPWKTGISTKPFILPVDKKFITQQNHSNYIRLSTINMQYLNKTYTNYCNLSITSKLYNSLFSQKIQPNKIQNVGTSQYIKHISNKYRSVNKNTILNNSAYLPSEIRKKLLLVLSEYTSLETRSTKLLLANPIYKHHIESIIGQNFSCCISLQFLKTINIFQSALYLIDQVVYYIEKKVPFFKLKNAILRKLTQQKSLRVKGIRVMCSGRVGGKSKKAQKSKIQNFKYGETSLHMFSSKIDFESKSAFTNFGTLGIKIWICYF